MKITVLIATYNRKDDLQSVLLDLIRQEGVILGTDYEIIISDNNSNDGTKDLVYQFINKYGNDIRYFFEPRQGKPYALNLAIPESRGDWIWLTDDDVKIESNFIKKALEVINKAEEKGIGLIGGKVDPVWEIDRPDWFIDDFLGCVAVNNIEGEKFILSEQEIEKVKPWNYIFGANMFVRKDVFDKVGLYSEKHKYAQDTEIARRICKAGFGVLLTDKISVGHKIPRQRMTKDYIRLWFYRRGYITGQTMAYKKKWYHFLDVPWEYILKKYKMTLLSKVSSDEINKLRYETKFNWYQGILDGINDSIKGESLRNV